MEVLTSLVEITLLILVTRVILNLVFSFMLSKRLKDSQEQTQTSMNVEKSMDQQKEEQAPEVVVEMVTDNHCGKSIKRDDAYIVHVDGKDFYFCSWDCREKFLADMNNTEDEKENNIGDKLQNINDTITKFQNSYV